MKSKVKCFAGLLLWGLSLIVVHKVHARKWPLYKSLVYDNPANLTSIPVIYDPMYSSYAAAGTPWFQSFNNLSVKNVVRFSINRDNHKFINQAGSVTIIFLDTIQTYTPGITGLSGMIVKPDTVVLTYDTSQTAKETDLVVVVHDRAVRSSLNIISVTYSSGGGSYGAGKPDIQIQNTIEIDRISVLSTPAIITPGLPSWTQSKPNAAGRNQFLTMNWQAWPGAEEYELEYTFINYPASISGYTSYTPMSLSAYVYHFRHNATRVIVSTGSEYSIPNLFPDGFLIFRWRPVTRDLVYPEEPVYGSWSMTESGTVNLSTLLPGNSIGSILRTSNPHPGLNWTVASTFAEESKIATGITYFDGTLRAREAVTYSNATGNFIVNQTVPDALGREAIKTLPSVALDNHGFAFRAGFNKNTANQPYSYLDFDLNEQSPGKNPDEISVGKMLNTSGANQYYSSAFLSSSQYNALDASAKRLHTFIPDAGGYAFSQVEFTRDPSGRTWRQGGAGKTHQLKTYDENGNWIDGHQTLTYDGTPLQEELDLLFGNEVGEYRKYKKIMSQDPNGQLSIAYMDPYGRTIATGLAGNPSNTPNLDSLGSSAHTLSLQSSMYYTWEDKFEGVRKMNQEILVPNDGIWKFYYSYPKSKFSVCDEDLCMECAYDLTFSVTNPYNYNKQMLPGEQPITVHLGQPVADTFGCSEFQMFQYSPGAIEVFLPKGSYVVSRSFKINKEIQNGLKEQWLAGSSCVKSFSDFLAEEKSKIGNSCEWTCEDCNAAKANLKHQLDSIRSYCQSHSLDTGVNNSFLATKIEYADLQEFCKFSCEIQSPCETLYQAILEDISPGGQYAKYMEADETGVTKTLEDISESTIFKSGTFSWSCLNTNGATTAAWRFPQNPGLTGSAATEYLTEDGQIFLIPVISEGGTEKPEYITSVTINGIKYTYPSQLTNVEDFITMYNKNPHWAKSLAYLHPEYCYYEKCKQIEPVLKYNYILLGTADAQEAIKSGFYNPLQMSGSGQLGTHSGNTLDYSGHEVTAEIRRDPLLLQAGNHIDPETNAVLKTVPGGSTNWMMPSGLDINDFIYSLSHYSYNYPGGSCSTSKTIWELMEEQRANYGLSSFDTCVEDLFWPLLRSMYLSKRQEWLNNWMETGCSSGCSSSLAGIKTPRWKKMSIHDLKDRVAESPWFNRGVWDDIDKTCNPQNITSKINDQIQLHCDNQCDANVENWMRKLSSCFAVNSYLNGLGSSGKDSVLLQIRDALKNMCMGGCDLDNPYGSTSVDPAKWNIKDVSNNYIYPYRNVAEVLSRFLTSTGNGNDWFSAGICDDLLIDFPGQYGHDYLAYNGPGMDSCACKKDKNIREGIASNCPPFGGDSLKLNDCGCNRAKDLRDQVLTSKGIAADQKCQNCITCKELDEPVADFLDKYAVESTSDTLMMQRLLQNSLNQKLGFNLNYSDYIAFAMSCIDTTELQQWPWYKVWQAVGKRRLVTDNSFHLNYSPPLFETPGPRTEKPWNLSYPVHSSVAWIASAGDQMIAAPSQVFRTQSVENVECNCRKILTAAKISQATPGQYSTGELAFTALYGSTALFSGSYSFADLQDKCCELYNTGNTPAKSCPDDYKIGEPFSNAARAEINNQVGYGATSFLADQNCEPETEEPCYKELDTCGCNKLREEYLEYETWKNNGFTPPKPPIPAGVSFTVYLNYTTGVTTQNADDLQTLCTEIFYRGVAMDDNDNPVRNYSPGNPVSWWSKTARSNLKQKVQDFKNTYNLRIPASWSCNTNCNEETETACTKVLSPCQMYLAFKIILPGILSAVEGGSTRREKIGLGSYGYGDNLGELLSWADQYQTYLDNNSNPAGAAEQARVQFLRDLFTQLNAWYKANTCPTDRPAKITLEYLLKMMLGCGSGSDELSVNEPCITAPDCQSFGARIKALLAETEWPKYNDPDYANQASYAIDFQNWYTTYLASKANGTNTTAEDAWVAALEADLNAHFNACHPEKAFKLQQFMGRLYLCLPYPKGTTPPCSNCYTANQPWLDALQTFLSDVTEKPLPDRLNNFSFYLKPNPGLNPKHYYTSFFNSVLYQNGTDPNNLKWTLNDDYEGGNLMPGLRTLIKDNNGFKLDLSLDWPTSEPRWNFGEIMQFINIRPVKAHNCDAPKYFMVDVVYKVPEDYLYLGNPWDYIKNFPSLNPIYCYDTITLIGKIWESSTGLGVGKQVNCLGCGTLCNRPFATVATNDREDPCAEEQKLASYNALQRYNAHIHAMGMYFDSVYREKCFAHSDSLTAEYTLKQYHYTLYYYDQAGQLIKTVPPAGVDIDNEALSAAQRQALADDRVTTARRHRSNNALPRAKIYHGLITNYRYYSGGQLAWQHTPDGGESRFWYDGLGRVCLSSNSKQWPQGKYNFTEYDYLGRAIKAGEMEARTQTVTETDYLLSFDEAVSATSGYGEDGISIEPGSGHPANTLEFTNSWQRRLKFPAVPNPMNPSARAYMHSFELQGGTTYTLQFQATAGSTLHNQFQYAFYQGATLLGNGTLTANGTQTLTLTPTGSGTVQISLEFTANIVSTGQYYFIDDLSISHAQTGIQIPAPSKTGAGSWAAQFVQAAKLGDVVSTWYNQIPDSCAADFNTVFPGGQGSNLRNRIAFVNHEVLYDTKIHTYDQGTAFSYDIHGNADRIVHNIPSLKHMSANLYSLDYTYDLISGNTHEIKYQANRPDQWIHRYLYDADNRLHKASTSRDGYHWEQDARYQYYLHGPLARTELGQLQVQGVDMAYNLQGWIKGVNSPDMTAAEDMGLDGYVPSSGTNANQFVARDAFAYHLGYYENDYKGLNNQTFEPQRAGSDLNTRYRELFNGNIAYMGTLLPTISGTNSWAGNGTARSRKLTPSMLGNVYHYDQLNRITKHYAYENYSPPGSGGVSGWQANGATGDGRYFETFAYDAVGNISHLNRNAGAAASGGSGAGQAGSGPTMDNMQYSYDLRTVTIALQQTSATYSIPVLKANKLYHVNDAVTSTDYGDDIDDQGTFNATPSTINTANNYGYDELGNLIRDNAEQIANIEWTPTGKIRRVKRSNGSLKPDLVYGYDYSGTRLFKVVIPKVQSGSHAGSAMLQEKWDTTWYIKDFSGNAMATYKTIHLRPHADTLRKQFVAEEYYIYGAKRHGTMREDKCISEARFAWKESDYGTDGLFTSTLPNSRYIVLGGTGYSMQTGISNYSQGKFSFQRGCKQYELANHLGNVLATVQDRKWGQNDSSGSPFFSSYYLAYVATVTDYYAFGSTVKERTISYTQKYRFGFTNQEQETELGDYYSFEYRVHDARLGRFLSVDPLSPQYPWNSAYAFAENIVIWCKELEGLEAVPYMQSEQFPENPCDGDESEKDGSLFKY
ncbi:MAG: hypothetical protein JNL57_13310, partial [Bacteroidetes bacterium]|nr:hypothetical protein [Bacteroidota bacterium]